MLCKINYAILMCTTSDFCAFWVSIKAPPPLTESPCLNLTQASSFSAVWVAVKGRGRKEGRPGSRQIVMDQNRKTWTKSYFSSPFCFPVRFERNELWNCDFFFFLFLYSLISNLICCTGNCNAFCL